MWDCWEITSRKGEREMTEEYDQSILYPHMKVAQWNPLKTVKNTSGE
jgi:hypothetical protein